jgi:hypothetical protein
LSVNKIPSGWQFASHIIWIRELAELIRDIIKDAPAIVILTMGLETLFRYLFVFCDINKSLILELKSSKDINEMFDTIFSNKSIRDAGKDAYYSNNYELDEIKTKKYLETELESLRIKYENKKFKLDLNDLQDRYHKLEGKTEAYERILDDKQEKEKKKIDNMAQSYIMACETYITEKPALKHLSELSTISKDIWKKQLSNSAFLFVLLKAIEKKKNLAYKTKVTFWTGAYSYINKKFNNALQDEKVKRQSFDDNVDYNRESGKKKKSNLSSGYD